MLLLTQKFLLALFIEVAGVMLTAGILYLYWEFMTKKKH